MTEVGSSERRMTPASAATEGGHRRRLRRFVPGALAGVCCLLILLSTLTVWAHRTVISTSGFVTTVGPVLEQPAVSDAMSIELTNQVFTAIDVERNVTQALPVAGKFLAAPLVGAARGFVQQQILKLLRSSSFRNLAVSVLRVTHGQVIAALQGRSDLLRVSNGTVVLDVLPLLDSAMQQVQSSASGLLGRDVTIPDITSFQRPSQNRATLSQALGVQLPADFAQIPLANSGSLELASNSVRLLDVGYRLLPFLTLVAILAALRLSTDRRRTSLQILLGTAMALVVARRAASLTQTRLIADLHPANRGAARAVIRQLLRGIVTATDWMLIVGLVAVMIILLTGPYRWARSLRGQVAGRSGDIGRVEWVVDNHRIMQAAGAIVGAVLLWLAPGWWFLVVAVAVALYEVVLWRAGSAKIRRDLNQ